MKLHRAVPLLLLLTLTGVIGCSKNNSTGPGFGSVRVSMTDAPAAYDEVNVVIREVRVHRDGAGENDGWYTVRPDSATTYDLLDLQNGVFVTLGFARNIPAGSYDQVRLVLGDGSTIVVDGVSHPLVVPSGTQSGIKIVGDFDVPDGGVAEVLLDFEASKSVHQTGNGTWMLRPVIRMVSAVRSGAIHGDLEPPTDAEIHVMVADTTFAGTSAGDNGEFTVSALPAGTYDVHIDVLSGYRDTTLTDIVVQAGQTTQLGTIALTPQ